MLSQEDLQAYERVRNAMAGQPAGKNTGLKVSLAVTLFLLLTAVGSAAFLGYNVYYLNNAYLKLQSKFAGAVADYNRSAATERELNDTLRETTAEIQALRQQKSAERTRYNQAIERSNGYLDRLNQAYEEVEAANQTIRQQNQDIDRGNRLMADYIEINASLEDSVTQLNASVSRLKSTNNSLTRENRTLSDNVSVLTSENRTLTGENNSLTQRNSVLASENRRLTSSVSTLNSRVSSLQSQLIQAKAQQVTIPNCASNYYTVTGGKLSCVARNSSAFQATQTETSTVRLPHSGTVNLRINRSGDLGSDRSMEILEHAVKTIEEYMGEPIPLRGNEIRLDFVEKEVFQCSSHATGCYLGTHIEILEEYDSEKPLRDDDKLAIIIAHEVAHYYFSGERDWLDEGAAEFLAIYVENKRVGRAMTGQGKPCAQTITISYLESRKLGHEDDGFTCNYTLGEGLFLDLFSQIQTGDFQSAFRRLYASSNNKVAGIHQVRQAFYPGSERVQKTIDKWYGYREKPEAHWNNGTFLGYMTWEATDGWKLYYDGDSPCATILRLSDQIAGSGYTVRPTEDECYYKGNWEDNGDLIVTIDGKEYRAVAVEIDSPPSRFDFSLSIRS